jgi:two-component system nitrogen regulation sensor histidine kinase NtrY
MPSFTPKPTDLQRLLESVVGLYGETHPAVLLRADLAEDLPTLDADGDQLKRAVLNLVDNAVEAGATEVVIAARWSGGEDVRIDVVDNGPGIPADLRDRVFLPYFSTKTTGMGLGLPIVHQIVSDHGGRIRVEENVPTGSRFVIELPALRGSTPAVPTSTLNAAGAPRPPGSA